MARLPRPTPSDARQVALRWIEDRAHYDVLLGALERARVSLWIATATLKDVRVEAPLGSVARARARYESVVERFDALLARGVELRVLHAAPPSRPFRESLSRRARLSPSRAWLRQCPRVHLKLIAVDGSELYLGSANFTGAGFGAKGDGRRNFELGVATSDHVLLDAAQRRFDRIWSGAECAGCRLRAHCPAPLDGLDETERVPKPRPVVRKAARKKGVAEEAVTKKAVAKKPAANKPAARKAKRRRAG